MHAIFKALPKFLFVDFFAFCFCYCFRCLSMCGLGQAMISVLVSVSLLFACLFWFVGELMSDDVVPHLMCWVFLIFVRICMHAVVHASLT